jgi:hypothetical protein
MLKTGTASTYVNNLLHNRSKQLDTLNNDAKGHELPPAQPTVLPHFSLQDHHWPADGDHKP